jgi:Flp pilus assembly protein TadD/mono/diheme cytochrome c family protein
MRPARRRTPPSSIQVIAAALVAVGSLPSGIAAAAGGESGTGGQVAGPVTFTRDIAPILYARCADCHRPGGIGPFSLTTYEGARERAADIAAATAARRMPPWKPVAGHGRFRNERRLAETEIALLARWAATGAPEGDPTDLPPPPSTADGWQLGAPDLVVTMQTPFRLPAGGADVYRNFVLPAGLDARRWVRAVELRPGAGGGRVIHHARILLDATGTARSLDAADTAPGYDGLMLDHARFPAGHFLGWAPGKSPAELPEQIAWPLDPGTDLVLQLHLLPAGEPLDVQPAIGLYFADRPATLTPVSVLLTSKAIRIPAGAPAHVIEDSYQLPIAVDVLGIAPHMHYLGKQVEARATLPDGREEPLLRIDDWDFNWQDEYRYREPVHLPAGTRLRVRFTFDNSTANPRNPHAPPVTVGFGPRAGDEMAELMLQVLPVGDPDVLVRNLALKRARDDILGYQSLLRTDPDDHVNHAALAVRYLDVGQVALAREHLEQAAALAPDFADAHYNLGSVALAEGDAAAAIASYRRAIALRPDYPEAHNNLGGVLAATGALDEALVHYRSAVRFDPGHSGAHYNIANVLLARGETEEAIRHYRLAQEAAPDDPDIASGLARAQAMADEPAPR